MSISTSQRQELRSLITKGIFEEAYALKQQTTIKIGGPASVFIRTDDQDEIRKVLNFCDQEKIPRFILGGGSNLLFPDSGFDGVVLKNTNKRFEINKVDSAYRVTLGAGFVVHLAATKLAEEGLSGFEYLFGLPGQVGGALFMNSKWPKDHYSISDTVYTVQYLESDGTVKEYQAADGEFSYGFSKFQKKNGMILSSTFSVTPKSKTEINALCQEVMAYRHKTQPTGVLTAGCVFKNITEEEQLTSKLPTRSAGYLIDKIGFKNKQYGGILVSPVHANFFVNTGNATAKDYLELVELVKTKVREQFGVTLRQEVELITIQK